MTDRSKVPCPIGRAADVLGDRWTLLILRNATIGMARFDELRAALGIADNILANRLGRLVDAGLLVKVPYRDGGRTRHEYRLTEAAADTLPVLHALAGWGARHTTSAEPAEPMRVLHTVCGSELAAGEFCAHCDRTVPRAEIAWTRPWATTEELPLAEPVT
ncbi:MAG TPA: helix-turn-helix domain-containing protein [Pseudonocardiaceae bacterium]|nr:helix-turn-helix domain-containing protein [Pseudonocardiaceae bacterium]